MLKAIFSSGAKDVEIKPRDLSGIPDSLTPEVLKAFEDFLEEEARKDVPPPLPKQVETGIRTKS